MGLLPPVSESNIDARRRNRARCRSSGCPTVMVAKRKNRTIRDSDAGEPGSNPALGKQRSRDHPIDSPIADAPRREPSLRLTRSQWPPIDVTKSRVSTLAAATPRGPDKTFAIKKLWTAANHDGQNKDALFHFFVRAVSSFVRVVINWVSSHCHLHGIGDHASPAGP